MNLYQDIRSRIEENMVGGGENRIYYLSVWRNRPFCETDFE